MGTPTGAIMRRVERVKWIADRIKRGEAPSRLDIMRHFHCSNSIAYRSTNLAIRYLAGEPIVPQESGTESSAKMKARRKVLPLRLEFAGGFRALRVCYGTMWGKPFGEIGKDYDITGVAFSEGKLPLSFVQGVAREIAEMAKEKWQHLCDLTAEQVDLDIRSAGIDVEGGAGE